MNSFQAMFVPTIGMPRLLLGWVLCCSFFTAQTRVQSERLQRAQQLSAPSAECQPGQPLPRADHLGCGTTRALKPSPALAWLAQPRQRAASPNASRFIEHPGHRTEPLPERTAERPVLRI
jgi:hypothetical protein